MKKRIVICLMCMLCILAQPMAARAAAPIQVDRDCSLTLQYTQGENAFPGLNIQIYRVAEIFTDGTYALWGDFAEYPVNIYGITSQTEWKQVTSTLVAYAAADHLVPDRQAVTDETGMAYFDGLETGMYLVLAVRAEKEQATFLFESFLVSVPNPDENGTYLYDVTAKPKCSGYEPTPGTLEYKVVKHWKDDGETRPESIIVDILKDGVLQYTQVLSAENNWSYVWKVSGDGSVWQAVERHVPEGYQVTVVSSGNTVIITNVRTGQPEKPPETGDTTVLWPYMLAMCISGGMLVILGISRKRKAR